ncbi:MAG: hypothetical protein JWO07_87 [Candidatus Saccharibacteria bacterium]|nr:hypothetical protein [Candidatus Saccharibacteria bacterium]
MDIMLYVASVFLDSTKPRHVFVWIIENDVELSKLPTHDPDDGSKFANVSEAQDRIRVIVGNKIRRQPTELPWELIRITKLPHQTIVR